MRKTLRNYSLLSLAGAGLFLGTNIASAHAFFGSADLTPEQIATRQTAVFQREATILGISIDEVKEAWAQGKTMKEIMTEKGITKEQVDARVKAAALAEQTARLQALVSKGVITQAQANTRVQALQAKTKNMKEKGGMHGMRGGHRGGFEFGFGR